MNIIDYIVKHTDLKQKDIARELGVSAAQVTKWKNGEPISLEKQERLGELAGLFGDDVDWALLVATPENARAWIDYIKDYAQNNEYDSCDELLRDPAFEVPCLLMELNKMGLQLPDTAPVIDLDSYEDETNLDRFFDAYLSGYAVLRNWCDNYLPEYIDDYEIDNELYELKYSSYRLAFKEVPEEVLESVGLNPRDIEKLIAEGESHAKKQILKLCRMLNASGIPFTTDYMRFATSPIEELANVNEKQIAHEFVSTDALLPYSQKRTLELLENANELLASLFKKVSRLEKHLGIE